ncbi:MAG: hypothetical protein V1886_03130 [archaeon]
MKPLKQFSDFLKEGIVKKQSPDKKRANSLKGESEDAYNFLMEVINKIGVNDNNANYIVKNAYDIFMEMVRAVMLTKGFNSSGSYAHEAEVSYLRELKFPEPEVQFTNQLRYFRNGITYYGIKHDSEYAKKVLNFLGKIYPKLGGMLA